MATTVEYISEEELLSMQKEYWRQVATTDGFDIDNVSLPLPVYGMITGLIAYDCEGYHHYPYRALVKHFAKLGLHRYNMLKGTSFQLGALLKFNMLQNCVSSFYMTLLAYEANSAPSTLQKTFQVRIDEQRYGSLDLTCSIARPKDEVTAKEPFIPHFHGGAAADGIFKGELPAWPSNAALNNTKRFYMVKKSEWEASDWISMYLALVICANDRSIKDSNVLSGLEILKVAMETGVEDVEPPNERLKAKSAHVYIVFRGLAVARAGRRIFEIGEHVERRAIVRRVIDEHSGYLTLLGKLCDDPKYAEQQSRLGKLCDERVYAEQQSRLAGLKI